MSGNWQDLRPRLISAAVMIALGLAAIWSGHLGFSILLAVAGVIGLWELWRMAQHKGTLSSTDKRALALYFVLFALGLWGLWAISHQFGRGVVLYLVAMVVVTDTMGYFAGRTLGGPKFWPAISPKKTWSGTIGGWIGAAVLAMLCHGALFADKGPGIVTFVLLSVALAFASQLGDIAQSAIKRRMGVKDSSNIIPGHGGVLDRFDALLAVGALGGLVSLFG